MPTSHAESCFIWHYHYNRHYHHHRNDNHYSIKMVTLPWWLSPVFLFTYTERQTTEDRTTEGQTSGCLMTVRRKDDSKPTKWNVKFERWIDQHQKVSIVCYSMISYEHVFISVAHTYDHINTTFWKCTCMCIYIDNLINHHLSC